MGFCGFDSHRPDPSSFSFQELLDRRRFLLDSRCFLPGTPTVLEVRDYQKAKYTSHVRGCRGGQFLILDHPLRDGRPIALADATPCIVRLIHDGEIIGFRTEIMSVVRNPAPLIFLRYPENFEKTQLRKHARYPVAIETILSKDKLKGRVNGQPRTKMLNLSAGGCMIESPAPMDLDSFLYLTVFLPEQDRVDDLEAEVKRCFKMNGGYELGLSFSDPMAPTYERIVGYVQLLEAFRVRA
jgi:c-di-GMP-binding flagellar brake protein YcgR